MIDLASDRQQVRLEALRRPTMATPFLWQIVSNRTNRSLSVGIVGQVVKFERNRVVIAQ